MNIRLHKYGSDLLSAAGVLLACTLASTDAWAIQVNLTVNNDASCTATSTRVVILNNTVNGATPKYYRASEPKAGLETAAWRNYETAPTFTLSSGAGSKVVYFQVQGTADGSTVQSETVGDAIEQVVPSGSVTLSINSGATSTTNRTVTLNNTATLSPAGTNQKYIASENSDFTGATWQAYSNAPQFQLSDGTGTKTVYMMVSREICGTISAPNRVSDSINYALAGVAMTALPVRHTFRVRYKFFGEQDTPTDVIRYAESQGFTHAETRTAGNGSCPRILTNRREWSNIEDELFLGARAVTMPVFSFAGILQSLTVSPVTCRFTLFGGRRLSTGWRAVSVTGKAVLNDYPWAGLVTPFKNPSGSDLSTGIQVVVNGGQGLNPEQSLINANMTILALSDYVDGDFWGNAAQITEIIIEGPSTDWRDAFRRP